MNHRIIAAIVGVSAFVFLAATGADIGLTYDEPIYMTKSLQSWEWLSSGAPADDASIEQYWQAAGEQQPGSMKLIFGIITNTLGQLLPLSPLAALRLGTVLLSALCLVALYLFVARIWGTAAGLVGSMGLLCMPRVFTHMHLAALDAPVMALGFITVALVYMAAGEDVVWPCVVAGVVFGIALGTKLNAFFIPLIIIPWVLYYAPRRISAWTVGSLFIIGPLAFFATWPWLWHDMFGRFADYFRFHLHHYHVATTYFGQAWELAPWHYAPVMLLITTPPILLALAGLGIHRAATIGIFTCAEDEGTQPDTDGRPNGKFWHRAALALLVWGTIVNIVPSMLPFAPKYNGVRLFLAVFPYLAGLAGVGLAVLSRPVVIYAERKLGTALHNARVESQVLLVLAVILPCIAAVGYSHPLGMSYYNSLVGGPGGAYALGMEPTYWGDSYLQAVWWLNEKAQSGETVWINVPGFATSVQMYQSLGIMRPDLNISAGDEGLSEADYVVVQHKQNEMSERMKYLAEHGSPLYAETLDGVPVVWIFAGDDPALKEFKNADTES